MRVNYNYIKIIGLASIVVFLFAFSNQRNNSRTVSDPVVSFSGTENIFITHDNVSKLLIQSQPSVSDTHKEIIDLNRLETALKSNPMIKEAQVYMSVNAELSAEIEQKQPIARVHTNASYYIDDEGKYMPLSTNYSARVPLVTGTVRKNNLDTVYTMSKIVKDNEFLEKHVVEIHQNDDGTIALKMRTFDFTVELGTLKNIEKKINNFKAFYKKALKDKTLSNYSSINLRFDSQVICTKK